MKYAFIVIGFIGFALSLQTTEASTNTSNNLKLNYDSISVVVYDREPASPSGSNGGSGTGSTGSSGGGSTGSSGGK